MKNFSNRTLQWLDSPLFFRLILSFFVFESVWIALSAAYPQAFDENFHFGLIQVYSHYWLPFLSSQPPHADAYGAVARDPSYLYHYLMSFPYRLIALFVHGQAGQVILLRFINIGLLSWGLILLRRVLLRVRISRPLTNVSLLLFALIPIVPQLAAQINYDNLLIPLTALSILCTFQVIDQIRARRPSLPRLIVLISLCLFTSLVKYAYLPIFVAIVVFLLIIGFRAYRRRLGSLFIDLRKSWRRQSARIKVLLAGLLLLSAGMFVQRDVVNLVKYHAIEPDCSTVLTIKQCNAYSPWHYNYVEHNKVEKKLQAGSLKFTNPVSYVLEWIYWMWFRLFFAINGPASGFTNYPPLPLPSIAAGLLGIGGVIVTIKWWRRIFRNNIYLVLLFVVSAFYTIALLAQGYSTYRYTNVLENMNGRYLLPILLLVAAIVGRAFSLQLRNTSNRKVPLAIAVLLLFLQGGGLFTFIARSDDSWDMPNAAVQKVNDVARHITNPVLVNGKKSYNTHLWFFN